jgi:hypothetical protein
MQWGEGHPDVIFTELQRLLRPLRRPLGSLMDDSPQRPVSVRIDERLPQELPRTRAHPGSPYQPLGRRDARSEKAVQSMLAG